MTHGLPVTHFRSLNAKLFGLTIDAFSRRPLTIDAFIDRMMPIHRDTQYSSFLDIDVFDTSFVFGKLLMIAALSCLFRQEQRTLVTLGAIAIGVVKLLRWNHSQFFRAQRNTIRITCVGGVSMLI